MAEKISSIGAMVLDATAVLYLVALAIRLAALSRPGLKKVAKWSLIVALAVHTLGLLLRWTEGGLVEVAAVQSATGTTLEGAKLLYVFLSHPPFTNLYETLVFFAWGIGVATAFAERRREPGLSGVFALVLLWVSMGLASLSTDRQVEPLVPALRSFWLHAHVAFASFAYASFALAAVHSVLYLLKEGVRPAWFGTVAASSGLLTTLALGRGGLLSGKYGAAAVGLGADDKVTRLLVLVRLKGVAGNEVVIPRFDMPIAGWLLVAGLVFFCISLLFYIISIKRDDPKIERKAAWSLLGGTGALALVGIVAVVFCLSSKPLSMNMRQAIDSAVGQVVSGAGTGIGREDVAGMVTAAHALAKPPYRLSPRAFPYDFSLMVLVICCSLLAFAARSGKLNLVAKLPAAGILESRAHNATLVGFPLMTLVIVTGAIWANYAWGRYWGWDPKETWSLITWFVYAIYLHARFTKGWSGRRAALISVLGFFSVVFTFLGVNLLLAGLHSYATG
ncbi:MAG: cytochrome c biogenesis protein CcsA [Deltaproteobacteria bacterium]|nr:cytochrome c biogenesis protein CcsA [Deltaproteobacteria bacterium]